MRAAIGVDVEGHQCHGTYCSARRFELHARFPRIHPEVRCLRLNALRKQQYRPS